MSLPKGYKRLEYIQSSGTQHIDSGFIPNQDTRVVCKAQYTDTSGSEALLGSRYSTSKDRYDFVMTGGVFYSVYNNNTGTTTATATASVMVIDKNKNITSIDGVVFSTQTYASFQCPGNLLLFANNTNNTPGLQASATIYSCQIYDNGTLVRDFIPCQNADGAVGLWDDANGVFYGNAGTGTFTAGPVIQAPGKPSGLAHALSVRLVWSAVSGAASYNIYRDGAFVGSSNTPTFVDVSAAENQTYVYAVSAVGQGVEGEPATLTVYTKAGYFEYKPLIESANFQ